MVSKALRLQIQEEARYLVQGGLSRRKMDAYLVAKFGHSIGKQTHTRIYQQRGKAIVAGPAPGTRVTFRPARPAAAPQPLQRGGRLNRRQRYHKLTRTGHFLPAEAREMARKLRTLNTNEVKSMADERARLWENFSAVADAERWSLARQHSEWRKTVMAWYHAAAPTWIEDIKSYLAIQGMVPYGAHKAPGESRRNADDRLMQRLIWEWYGYNKSKIPKELQTETPKHHRVKPQRDISASDISINKKMQALRQQIREGVSPPVRVRLQNELAALQERQRAIRQAKAEARALWD